MVVLGEVSRPTPPRLGQETFGEQAIRAASRSETFGEQAIKAASRSETFGGIYAKIQFFTCGILLIALAGHLIAA